MRFGVGEMRCFRQKTMEKSGSPPSRSQAWLGDEIERLKR
ncbi:hypothetical protein A2U01_0104553 [Trifolium medium]|uniref:Uncharacterized protein n=1 Tax=Trifolium medium TaxID=97028 RepID=A0A392V4Q6_9FABA|nr:hypothetical protein [Trifolium medium]